jgi:hypothetical protein
MAIIAPLLGVFTIVVAVAAAVDAFEWWHRDAATRPPRRA